MKFITRDPNQFSANVIRKLKQIIIGLIWPC